ncbi:putative ATP-dependent RNA helicase TDRD12 [Thalassophryne amazonica]|uniref:putative ATP-dependent RNA helicase TDRD12 n=1 Tax=Thalassophryne amazonica TaxID=390379 RepID=UPI0014708A6C|nr:putative ATP-dependent RNA helicase TDRD12 [Thalassophryne amazonica]
MLKISILKVENPSCLWGRAVLGPDGDMEQYNNLQVQMNLFYNDVTRDPRELQPVTLEEGQVCVVYCSALKSWCRATVNSVLKDSVSSRVLCFLVDHGEQIVVPSCQVRVTIQKFLLLPFWARRFHLAGIKPTTLRVLLLEEKAELTGSSQWTALRHSTCTTCCKHQFDGGGVTWIQKEESTSMDLYVTVSTSSSSRSAEFETTCRFKESTCLRLLEWLNPVLLKPKDDTDVSSDPVCSEMLVHSAFPVEPCTSMDNAPITDSIRQVLQRRRYCSLSPAERYSWPAVARGCNTVVISSDAVRPLSYLPPLLTHILLNSSFSSTAGPVAVLVCPGWEKAQIIQDLLEETKVTQTLHPVMALVGIAKDEAKSVRIPKNCAVLVTTPFSLVRLLACHSFLFLHLFHLVLDEADKLFSLAPDQMEVILQHFHKVTSSDKNAFQPQQLVACAKTWTCHMEHLVTSHMPYCCVVITLPEEAALYGNVQQVVLMSSDTNNISVMLGALDFNPDVGQKTLIIAQSAEEVENICKVLTNKSVFCLRTHEGLTHLFDSVVQQWRKDVGSGTHIILVTTNDCFPCLGITDATCIVHYGFPSSPKVFGSRLLCMAENFRNLSEHDPTYIPPATRSVLLISERNSRHIAGVLRYLLRAGAPLPPELLSFAQGIYEAREDQKTSRPLCSYLKSFGVCRESRLCPDRHRFNPRLDQSTFPAPGVVEVLPLYVKTASVFYGRIVNQEHSGFNDMAADMASYYIEKKAAPGELLEGGLYAVLQDELFHRVKVLSVPDRGDRLFFSVLVWFLDVGKKEEVKSHQIFHLPDSFHSLPAQAVEMIVCRVKPADAETDWHPKVTRSISQKIRGLQHRARAVLSLGNTIFLDPMVRVTQVPGMKTVINEYNVSAEVLNTGMGVSNPDHMVDLLKALHQDAMNTEHARRSEDGALEAQVQTGDGVLADTFRVPELTAPKPLSPACSQSHPEPAPSLWGVHAASGPEADLGSAEHMRDGGGCEFCPQTTSPAQIIPDENGLSACEDQSSDEQLVNTNGADTVLQTKSFHPQVRWYQTSDSVVLKVDLINPEHQRCDFYPDRVVYSGTVSGRFYRAELELHAAVAVERCSWEMKSNKPVLKLIKQQPGLWDRLLRNKNIFVSFDTEHIDEEEDRTQKQGKGRHMFDDSEEERNGYVFSDSSSESD